MSMWYSVTVPTLEFDYLCTLYMNFLFSPVIVLFYFSSMEKLRFVNCCFLEHITVYYKFRIFKCFYE